MSTPDLTAVILDDHAVFRHGLRNLLAGGGIDVVAEAEDAATCLSMVALHEPDLCVLDHRLQGRTTCVDVARRITAAHPGTAVAVLTSFASAAAARDVVSAGARGFIIKDAAPDDLLRQLRSIAQGGVVIDPRVGARALAGSPSALSEQERAVMEHVANGMTNREIAAALTLSPHTVKEYVSNATRKLGARTRSEAVAVAVRDDLITPP